MLTTTELLKAGVRAHGSMRSHGVIAATVMLSLAAFGSPLSGQAVIRRHVSAVPDDVFGQWIVAFGDVTGDGIPDYGLGSNPYSPVLGPQWILSIRSGATGSEIRSLSAALPGSGGDQDGDGRNDLVSVTPLTAGSPLRLESVTTGTPLGSIPVPAGFQDYGPWVFLEDLNGDGLAEVIAAANTHNAATVHVFNNNLSLRATCTIGAGSGTVGARGAAFSDIDNDGWKDIVFSGSGFDLTVASSTTGAVLRTFTGASAASSVFALVGDLDNDAVVDLVRLTHPLTALSGASGAVLWTAPNQLQLNAFTELSAAGDLDGDGRADLIAPMGGVGPFPLPGNNMLGVISGVDGRVVLAFRGGSPEFAAMAKAVGDLDGDGLSEVAQAEIFYSTASAPNDEVTILSLGATPQSFAGAVIHPTGCSPTPFFAHSAPPKLGATVRHDLLSAPSNSVGIIVIHVGLPNPLPIAGGCLVFPDATRVAEWWILPITTDSFGEFTFAAPIPADPAFLGISFTLQAGVATPTGIVVSTASVATIGL